MKWDTGKGISTSRPWLSHYTNAPRPQTTVVVSIQDVIDRQNILDSLQYKTEMLVRLLVQVDHGWAMTL